jgi:hypothetical protein
MCAMEAHADPDADGPRRSGGSHYRRNTCPFSGDFSHFRMAGR